MPDRAVEVAGRNRSASLRRALGLLDYLAQSTGERGATLSELAEIAEVDRSSASRLLTPLREVDLVETDESGRYHLGAGAVRIGQAYLDRLDLRRVALPVLHDVTARTGETAHLVLVRPPDVVYIEKVEPDAAVQMRSRVGRVEPAASTGVGRAFLAYAPRQTVDAVLAAGLVRRTPTTITSVRRWRAELAAVRLRGYAVDDCENEVDIRCVGAAIFDHRAEPAAALSVAGPANRLTAERVPELGAVIVVAARAISARLGAPVSAGAM